MLYCIEQYSKKVITSCRKYKAAKSSFQRRKGEGVKREPLIFLMLFLIIANIFVSIEISDVKAESNTWIVDDDGPADFRSIQEAVDAATSGDTLIVGAGIYTENIDVTKTLLIRSDQGSMATIVQAATSDDHVFEIVADETVLLGFTVKDATKDAMDPNIPKSGICLNEVENCIIADNIATNNYYGILLRYSDFNVIERNYAINNTGAGISVFYSDFNQIEANEASDNIYDGISIGYSYNNIVRHNNAKSNFAVCGIRITQSMNNIITGNNCSQNNYGIATYGDVYDNTIYLNYFQFNTGLNFDYAYQPINVWHSPEEIRYQYNGAWRSSYLGNYWDDYEGADSNNDGIGDSPHVLKADNTDPYPLIIPLSSQHFALSAYTSTKPTIDGVFSPGEWYEADIVTFEFSHSISGEFHPATFYVINDDDFLYMAIRIQDDDFNSRDHIIVSFDDNNNEDLQNNEDGLVVWNGWQSNSDCYADVSVSQITWALDANNGGTDDLTADSSHTNPSGIGDYTFELRHPINSADDVYDFDLAAGDIVGFGIQFSDYFGNNMWYADIFPYGFPAVFSKILIASGTPSPSPSPSPSPTPTPTPSPTPSPTPKPTETPNPTPTLPLSISTAWDPKTDCYSTINRESIWATDGNCYGYSSTALLYFMHYSLGYNNYPCFPAQSPQAFNTVDLKLPDIGGPPNYQIDTLNNAFLAITFHHLFDPVRVVTHWDWFTLDQDQQFNDLMNGLLDGVPAILGLTNNQNQNHAVIAWGLEQKSPGNYRIKISDPNSKQTMIAEYNSFSKSFSYTTSWGFYDRFIILTPTMSSISWNDWWNLFGTAWWWSDWLDFSVSGYKIIISEKPVSINSNGLFAFFTEPGNSGSFVCNIPGACGITEGNMQVYAIPDDLPFTVIDPTTEQSTIFVGNVINSGELSGHGCLVNVKATSGFLNFSITPSDSGLSLNTFDSDLIVDLALFSAAQDNHNVFQVSNIPLKASQTANFAVMDWRLLNSTKQSLVTLNIVNSNQPSESMEYSLVNGQNGIAQPEDSSTIFYLAIVIICFTISAGLMFYIRKRKKA